MSAGGPDNMSSIVRAPGMECPSVLTTIRTADEVTAGICSHAAAADGSTTTTQYSIATSPYAFSVSPTTTTNYSLTSLIDGNFCTSTPSSSVTVTVTPPSAPTVSITQPTCSVATGTVKTSKEALEYAAAKQQQILFNAGRTKTAPPENVDSLTL